MEKIETVENESLELNKTNSIDDITGIYEPELKHKSGFIPRKLKTFLFVLLLLYFDALLGFVIYEYFDNGDELYVGVGIIAVALNIFLLMLIIKSAKGNNKDYVLKYDNKYKLLSELGCNNSTIDRSVDEEFVNGNATVFDDGEINPNDDLVVSAKFDSELDLELVPERLVKLFAESGLQVEYSSAREILASLNSSKLIFIEAQTSEFNKKIHTCLARVFETPVFNIKYNERRMANLETLMWENHNGEISLSRIGKSLEFANENPKKVCITTYSSCDSSNLSFLDSFDSFISDPYNDHSLNIGQYQKLDVIKHGFINIPQNYWIVVEVDSLNNIPSKLLNKATIVRLKAEEITAKDYYEEEELRISYQNLRDLLLSDDNSESISEELWKKLDQITERLKEKNNLILGPKEICSFEDYCQTLLSLGDTPQEALDKAITNKVLYQALANAELKKDERQELQDFIDKILDPDNTNDIQKCLKNF